MYKFKEKLQQTIDILIFMVLSQKNYNLLL